MADLRYESKQITTVFKFDTEFSADSVEWCPHAPFQHVFVCANYELAEEQGEQDSKPCKRLGRILLFSMNPEKGLTLHQKLDTAAVLDQKWCHNRIEGYSLLGVVNAENKLEIYKLNAETMQLEIITFSCTKTEAEVLLLSLDWSTAKYCSETPKIVCSDSQGNVHIFSYQMQQLSLESMYHAHEYESWIVAFDYWDTNIFFSGGDDSLLLKFDTRVGEAPVTKNRSHDAGVTCIHSNMKREFVLATGSYDEQLRIWDNRFMKVPKNDVKMPGPLWRLKWDPFRCDHLLTACMLGGLHVVSARDFEDLNVVESYYEHKNIVYGADWAYLNEDKVREFDSEGNRIVGSCSFYDRLLCVTKLCIS